MRIQHNIMAMNAYRNYNNNTSALSKNLEKLSSGYKINRAGDDAAGLAISEKMRAQITGLGKAQDNAKDGISLVQTAEGALTEVHDMLNRMYELAEQSANGTYENETDRLQLQKEVDQLKEEIDRIADSANFNGIKLLDGSMSAATTSTSLDLSGLNALLSTALPGAGTDIGTDTVLYDKGKEDIKTKFEVDLSGLQWTGATVGNTMTITIGNASIVITATAAGDQDIGALLNTALSNTKTMNISGATTAMFSLTVDGDKLTFELDRDASAVATGDNAALGANWNVTFTAANGSTAGSQINAGTRVLAQGQKGTPEQLASTVLEATNDLGFDATTAANNDGKAITIDGKTYIIAQGKNSKYANITGDDVVVVKIENETATTNDQIKALANAIDKNSTTWNAGVNAAGELTLSQKAGTDGSGLTTLDDIAGSISVGSAAIKETTTGTNGKPLTLQIGDTSDDFNKLVVSIKDTHVAALGLTDMKISDQDSAAAALNMIKDSINYVSDVRGTLGATQNRLDHTINNLSVMQENIQDAESTIRDTDVAEEMMSYTKNNILIQSAQAMLAQANQVPQGVLQLLQ